MRSNKSKGFLRGHILALACVLIVPALESRASYAEKSYESETQLLTQSIFQELIEINTTHSTGNTTQAAKAMAERLIVNGFSKSDVLVLGPHPRRKNLVAKLQGSKVRKPLLLVAHIDVVEADREDWSTDPFKLVEKEGYFYGRGTTDNKASAAIWIANLIRLKQEGFVPDRDIIVALTADEEGGSDNGVQWLLDNHRELIDAEYAFNEGGYGQIKNGQHLINEVQLSEKVSLGFRLETKSPGGHSSLPKKDNAIYRLARGLTRLAMFDFPVTLNEGTRSYFEKMSEVVKGQDADDMKALIKVSQDDDAIARLSASPYNNAMMRTTCVATTLEAGQARNALPQSAVAYVNCRLLPGESPQKVKQTLKSVLNDDKIRVTQMGETYTSPSSPLNPHVMGAIEQHTEALWPGVAVVPVMMTGATDGSRLRTAGIPTYGVSGLFEDVDDIRAHGQNERIGVKAFYEGQEFLYQLVKTLSSKQ